ncbi:hypothetical protein NF867_06700 [Solitalea sp. MAHUQ-68]|uniref:Uncharacterized protein n=1 Tax=Solitalea agri TaxID=2953739 RepID=A0A9X2F8L5_9SPHI|nr:hypothetical protein [Solitalea agri]MCO4292543.1 hypothetical protein [Solitalea agri]
MTTAKQLYQKYKTLMPALILTGLCAYTLLTFIRGTVEISGFNLEFNLTKKHYGAFIAVAISLISYFAFRQFFNYILAFTLLLGLFCIINFTPFDFIWPLEIGSFKINFQPTAFLVGIFAIILNFKDLKTFFYT